MIDVKERFEIDVMRLMRGIVALLTVFYFCVGFLED